MSWDHIASHFIFAHLRQPLLWFSGGQDCGALTIVRMRKQIWRALSLSSKATKQGQRWDGHLGPHCATPLSTTGLGPVVLPELREQVFLGLKSHYTQRSIERKVRPGQCSPWHSPVLPRPRWTRAGAGRMAQLLGCPPSGSFTSWPPGLPSRSFCCLRAFGHPAAQNILLSDTWTEKAVAPHSSTLAWNVPWTEEPGGLQSVGRKESDTTEWLSFHFSLSCIGEGNGSPLQCSCLENPRDGGAWWAAICGVTQSRTRLKWLSSSSSRRYLEDSPSHSVVLCSKYHFITEFHLRKCRWYCGEESACQCRRCRRLGFDP